MKPGWVPPEKIADEKFGAFMAWLILLIFLWIMDISNALLSYMPDYSIFRVLEAMGGVSLGPSHISIGTLVAIQISGQLILCASALVLLLRQRWGLYGLIAVYLAWIGVDMAIGWFGIMSIIRTFVVPGITVFLSSRVWNYLE